MKKILAVVAVAMLALTGCSSSGSNGSAAVEEKTYTGTANGMGTVTVEVTVAGDTIKAVTLDCSGETATIGQLACQKWTDENTIVEANGIEFDNVSGSTVTSKAVKKALKAALTEAGWEF